MNEGRIAMAGLNGLLQVPMSGGTPSTLTTLDESGGELGHFFPQMVRGDRFIYWVRHKKAEENGEYMTSLSNPGDRVKLLTTSSNALYAPDGNGRDYLLYIRGVTLMAQQFDVGVRKLVGEPRAIADFVGTVGTRYQAQASASATGSLLYTSPIRYQFTWFDRTGKLREGRSTR